MSESTKNKFDQYQDDEVNLNKLFNVFKRNKKFITFFTGTLTTFSIIYSYLATPVYKGSFEIIVENPQDNGQLNDSNNPLQEILLRSGNLSSSDLETQKIILESPFVLEPVFNYVKDSDADSKSLKKMNFKSWRRKYLDVKFQEDTNVLSVIYKNKNKDFILDALEMILERYKSYSKSDRERELSKTITFLSQQQKIYKTKSDLSRKKLNLFSIENGLGDIDGFIKTKSNTNTNFQFQNDNLTKLGIQRKLSSDTSEASQRYKNQFIMLENYEAEYTNLSSRLKPNSRYLRNLELKIENLKTSLKRPNEILIKLRELKSQAERDESFFNSISDELVVSQLEKVKQLDPWKMISKPTIDEEREFPKRRIIVLIAFFSSLLISYIISILKEKKSGKLFDLDTIKDQLETEYLDTIYLNNPDISNKLVKSIINIDKEKIGLIQVDLINQSWNNELDKFLSHNNQYLYSVNVLDEDQMSKFSSHILFLRENKCTQSQIQIINKYIKIYKGKILGWFYVKDVM